MVRIDGNLCHYPYVWYYFYPRTPDWARCERSTILFEVYLVSPSPDVPTSSGSDRIGIFRAFPPRFQLVLLRDQIEGTRNVLQQ